MSAAVLQERLVYADSFGDITDCDLISFNAQLDMYADALFADLDISNHDNGLFSATSGESFALNELVI